jgi:hypothetical protein
MKSGCFKARWTRVAALGGGLAVLALSGCNRQPDHCTTLPEGEFSFQVDPAVDEQIQTVTATVRDVQVGGDTPATYEVDVRTAADRSIRFVFPRLGYALPVEVDSTYTFTFQNRGGVPAAFGFQVFDGKGLRYMGVTDWLPSEPRVFPDGYGSLGTDGALSVFFASAGCDPREENSACFREVRNYQLQFVLGSDRRLLLWNREQGRIGPWIFHVLKSVRVQVKAECVPQELQNQVSFFVVRDDGD